MAVSGIRFGTDGWRGVIAADFTFTAVRLVAGAIARQVLATAVTGPHPTVLVGYDTRFLSREFAEAAARVLAGQGLQVRLASTFLGSPLLSYGVVQAGADGGVMITASHNPPQYNGVKFKTRHGGSASLEFTQGVEREIRALQAPGAGPVPESGDALLEFDPRPAHRVRMKELADLSRIAAAPLEVFLDPMYGAGQGYLSGILRALRVRVTELHAEVNPAFGGHPPEPLARHLTDLTRAVINHPSSGAGTLRVGLAFDGDADRLAAVDEQGRYVNSHQIFALLLKHLFVHRGMTGRVVKAFSTGQMVDKLADAYGLPLTITPIGFKHIAEEMLKRDVLIGGEESGGVAICGHIPERDATLAALLLLEYVATVGKPLGALMADVEKEFGPHRYERVDVPLASLEAAEALVRGVTEDPPDALKGVKVLRVEDLDGVKMHCADGSWLLLRRSGTEPLLRIYAEGPSEERVAELLKWGIRRAKRAEA
jgi:phosphomannomutase